MSWQKGTVKMSDYEKYQLQWLMDHGYSLKDLMAELTRLQYEDPEDAERVSTPIDRLFAEWEADVGFGSEIWACEDEWRGCENPTDGPQVYELR